MKLRAAVVTERNIEILRKNCELDFFSPRESVSDAERLSYDAVFLVVPTSEEALRLWTGHPHLRCVLDKKELEAEIDFIFRSVELEYKFLIEMPDFKRLEKYYPSCSEIEQVYLNGEEGSHRIRKRVISGITLCVETVKTKTDGIARSETETSISEDEYYSKLKNADPEKHPIVKRRYCFVFKNKYFELDVYPFWNERAVLELELKDENEEFTIPPEINVIRDVTEDKRYKNSYLAGVKYEDYSAYVL
ncbi:MAG: hypothetical protein K6C14_03505 [Eubacterium sp.]|nr:hypothetical protein [Eubacterium sp.]